ncbi:hypothetical protein SELR_pSRC300450 (plasmid) [Selenomonas ruminantium subsp. lactilytica TAM6421]|uniref:Uncharacterized protein n=1 Tax=Selenomonas ruminantium subsp. lactilytica (strain NBRC 103574 / TAM6421) TaxID=927704 RepID=I0GWI1_SELRL|nr:hypothetical protein [Selenomonas ruminantium]BAL85118.1 hypothetical protein SELR_pSRC300450 [Selenomonas ruminantium subsp. lactilytica TAM6421]
MKRVNTLIIDLIMYVIGLYSRKKSVVTCNGVFCGYAYSSFPVRRYLYTIMFILAFVLGLIIGE